ncbi:GntR family transcriptional regulator [Gluconacetobacter liquefaciens]|uniref:GntR family transcriptional regulator n=1 Tax=Gluconacetobacter liquefaciens TaxID=89584 RepID=A0A7W4JJJ6_GLULI|nr:GntR family transcriptional regulator [Gluconacetobacter liquefaciens]MBB2185912.1 GntR family transcriptional regulator [Gluconacetobacter liquefaciens]
MTARLSAGNGEDRVIRQDSANLDARGQEKLERLDVTLFRIDRTLELPIGTQLKGQIEYGIGLGVIRPGQRLPPVRELAERLGISPVTVGQVYAELKRGGVLRGRTGAGTFVADLMAGWPTRGGRGSEIQSSIDALVTRARALGLSTSEVLGLVSARMEGGGLGVPPPSVMVVGNFMQTTIAYCRQMERLSEGKVRFLPTTVTQLQTNPSERQRVDLCQMAVTFAHRRAEVARMLPGLGVAVITFIPSMETRMKLAQIDPGSRVVLVVINPEFAGSMKAGVEQFAPHITEPAVVLIDAPECQDLMKNADVIVYATGADDLGLKFPDESVYFEYQHTPNPHDVSRLIAELTTRLP